MLNRNYFSVENSLPILAAALFFLFLSVPLFLSGLSNLVGRWETQPAYSHGYLLPLVAAYILYEKRWEIVNSATSDQRVLGGGIVFLSLIGQLIGELSALFILMQLSFVLYLYGIVVLLVGKAQRHFIIPCIVLCFGIPLPYFIEALITSKMQLISSQLGVELIRLCNIPVYLSGNIIDLGVKKLQVVEACSGLRYLFPLMSIGFIVAYFYRGNLWKRSIVFFATIPITIAMNSFRVAVTGYLVVEWGDAAAEGFMHDFEGWVIFLLCGVLLLCIVYLLERVSGGKSILEVLSIEENAELQNYSSLPALERSRYILMGGVVVLSIGTMLISNYLQESQFNPVSKNLALFPENIREWKGHHESLPQDDIEALQFTDYLLINYEDDSEQLINLYAAYYSSQSSGISPHSPSVCIPGGGWEIVDLARLTVAEIPVNRAVIQKGEFSQVVYYWFEERGQAVANEYYKKWLLFRDAVLQNRTDGTLVRITSPVYSGESIENASQRLESFLPEARGRLTEFLPRP